MNTNEKMTPFVYYEYYDLDTRVFISKNDYRRKRRFLLINRREAPHFLRRLSSVFGKKSGGFYKKRNLKALYLLA